MSLRKNSARLPNAQCAEKIVKKTLADARISAGGKHRLRKLAQRPDSEILFSDIPELAEEFLRNAVRNPFYRPVKKQLTLRLDAQRGVAVPQGQTPKIVAGSGAGRGAVVEENDAVGEGFGGEELEADEAMARLIEGAAFADEDADEVDTEANTRAIRNPKTQVQTTNLGQPPRCFDFVSVERPPRSMERS